MTSQLQAVLFKKDKYNIKQAEKFLKKHNLKPIKKVHVTKNYLRYRINQPNYKKYVYRLKNIKNGNIKFVIGIDKKRFVKK